MKLFKLILLLTFILTCGVTTGQNVYFNNLYTEPGEYSWNPDICQLDSAIYISNFYGSDTTNFGVGLFKFDFNGKMIWNRDFFNDSIYLFNNFSIVNNDSLVGLVISKDVKNGMIDHHRFVHCKPDGSIVLDTTTYFPDSIGISASCMLPDGSMALSGVQHIGDTNIIWKMIKIDRYGQIDWIRDLPLNNSPKARSNVGFDIEPTPDGGFVLSGRSDAYFQAKTIQGMVIKTDSLGDIEWIKDYGTWWFSSAFRVEVKDSIIYTIGSYIENGGSQPWEGGYSGFFGKYHLDGSVILEKMMNHKRHARDGYYDFQVLQNDDILVVGSESDISFRPAGWAYRMTNDGDSIWQRPYVYYLGQKHDHSLRGVEQLPNGDIAMVGQVYPDNDIDSLQIGLWLLKIDSMGCFFEDCDSICAEPPSTQWEYTIHPNLDVEFVITASEGEYVSMYASEIGNWPNDLFVNYSDTMLFPLRKEGQVRFIINAQNQCANWGIIVDTITVEYTDVSSPASDASVLLYPNPATHQLTLQWDRHQPGATLTLQNQQGQVLHQEDIQQGTETIPVAQLPAGLYLAILRDRDGVILHREKVMVVR